MNKEQLRKSAVDEVNRLTAIYKDDAEIPLHVKLRLVKTMKKKF